MTIDEQLTFYTYSIDVIILVANYAGVMQIFLGVIVEITTCLFLRCVFIYNHQNVRWTKLTPIEWTFMILGPINFILFGIRYLGEVNDPNGIFDFFVYVFWDPFLYLLYASLTCSIVCSIEEYKQGYVALKSLRHQKSNIIESNVVTDGTNYSSKK